MGDSRNRGPQAPDRVAGRRHAADGTQSHGAGEIQSLPGRRRCDTARLTRPMSPTSMPGARSTASRRMPATPEVVGAYLAPPGRGYAMSTLRRRVPAIARACIRRLRVDAKCDSAKVMPIRSIGEKRDDTITGWACGDVHSQGVLTFPSRYSSASAAVLAVSARLSAWASHRSDRRRNHSGGRGGQGVV